MILIWDFRVKETYLAKLDLYHMYRWIVQIVNLILFGMRLSVRVSESPKQAGLEGTEVNWKG